MAATQPTAAAPASGQVTLLPLELVDKAIGSRIRGAVSSVSFDDFHKNSARIIKVA